MSLKPGNIHHGISWALPVLPENCFFVPISRLKNLKKLDFLQFWAVSPTVPPLEVLHWIPGRATDDLHLVNSWIPKKHILMGTMMTS